MCPMCSREAARAQKLTFVAGVGPVVHLVQRSGLTVGALAEAQAAHGETYI